MEKGGLQSRALGSFESIIMGIAGTAPAYSIEVTASTIIATVGLLSPASILYCGLIMFGITFAFINLNRVIPHAGASYAWVGKIFGPTWGFFAGWALMVATSLFMVSGTIPAANAFLLILAPEYINNVHLITIIAAIILTAISLLVFKGIKLTSYSQILFTVTEIIILAIIAFASFVIFPKVAVNQFSLEWFSLDSFTPSLFAQGALVAMFFYWGWDVVMNLSEETKDPEKTAGRGALWSMVYLIIFFVIFMIIILMGLTGEEIEHYNTNVIYAVAEKLFGSWFGILAIIAVLLSTLGTLETSILQFTRTLFAKGRDGALHPRFSRVHEKWKTPYVSVIFIWAFGMILLLFSSYIDSVNQILEYFISAIGIQIAFYLGLAGFACAWYFRSDIKYPSLNAFTRVIWPFISATFLFSVAFMSAREFDIITNVVGFGGILIGAIPYMLNKRRKNIYTNKIVIN